MYLQADCGNGYSTNWIGPVNVIPSTSILFSGISCSSGNEGHFLLDDLESTVGWTGDFGTGNGIWRIHSGGTGSSGTGPSGAHSGSNYFYFESSTGRFSYSRV